jgi:methionyl-tRNA formyltransferase
MRIIVMGTGPFAVPSFQRLYESEHEVLLLVTQPGRPSRGRKKIINPMREIAEAHQTEVFSPESINTDEAREKLKQYDCDLYFVCDYGQILSAETLQLAKYGGINLHGSLLPKYRGAAPINWCLYHGESETGVTVIHMTPLLDGGPCIGQASIPIEDDDDAETIETKLSKVGVDLVLECIHQIETDTTKQIPQDPALVTKARRLRKTDGIIDWSRSASEIRNQIKAFSAWPKSYSHWNRSDGDPVRVIIGKTEVLPAEENQAEPGTVTQVDKENLHISTGDGILSILEIQPSGKRLMEIKEFLRGNQVKAGETFSDA